MTDTLSTRDSNKHKRRQRILDAARQILIAGGYDGLTTRGLAEAAGVTVPTIYNLIGGKDDVLSALIADDVEQTWTHLELPPNSPSLAAADYFITLCTRQLEEREDLVRASVLASDRVIGAYAAPGHSAAGVPAAGHPGDGATAAAQNSAGARSIEMATHTVQALQDGGALRGDIPALSLGEQLFICFRDPLRDWGYGLITLAEFERRLTRGVYMVLCCDATDSTRHQLADRIMTLESQQGLPIRQAATGS
jgi:AcrR family transcriptional regulator